MTSAEDLVKLEANCLCKANIFTTQIPGSKLPLKGWICHCDSCRHVTGALYTMLTPWPEPEATVDISGLKAYTFSPKYDILFCPTCSTPMFFAQSQGLDKELIVFTGTLHNDAVDLVKITEHRFVGDTQDGGGSMWLRKPNADGLEAKRYKTRAENEKGEPAVAIPYHWPSSDKLTAFSVKNGDPVPIWCKCKGVKLIWQPESYDGKKATEIPWFIDPSTRKALAEFCACDSCRLFGGVDVWTWAFADLKNISFAETQSAFPSSTTELRALVDMKNPSIGTLKYYASSTDVQRYFCSNCSASIFYAWDDRPSMVDVAIGVFEALDGARAESYLSWEFGGTIGDVEDNIGGWRYDLWQRVATESEDWRISRRYPKNWRRLAQEEAAKKG